MRTSTLLGTVTWSGNLPASTLTPRAPATYETAWKMARSLAQITRELGVPFIFKASYDKANRTSVKSARGPGLEQGCRILAAIGKELGVPVTTDVHSPEEATRAAEWI